MWEIHDKKNEIKMMMMMMMMIVVNKKTNTHDGRTSRMGSVMLLKSTVPTLAPASMGVNTK